MAEFTFSLPPDLFLAGLSEAHEGWRAYIKVRKRDGSGDMLGAVGPTPQAAIDRAVEGLRSRKIEQPRGPQLNIKINL